MPLDFECRPCRAGAGPVVLFNPALPKWRPIRRGGFTYAPQCTGGKVPSEAAVLFDLGATLWKKGNDTRVARNKSCSYSTWPIRTISRRGICAGEIGERSGGYHARSRDNCGLYRHSDVGNTSTRRDYAQGGLLGTWDCPVFKDPGSRARLFPLVREPRNTSIPVQQPQGRSTVVTPSPFGVVWGVTNAGEE